MKNKFLVFSTIISACVLSLACNKTNADDRQPYAPRGGQKCYSGNPSCSNPIESVGGDNMNGSQQNGTYAKKLKMDSIEKFQGTVKNVNRERQPDGRVFIQIALDTDEGEKTIMVGPARYVDQSKVKLQVGDKITVNGYRVGANGNEVIIAKDINKSGNVLNLLNDQRQPLWGGNGNGQNMMRGNPNMNGNGQNMMRGNPNMNGNGQNMNGNGYNYGYGYQNN